jgi:hypothetical protein
MRGVQDVSLSNSLIIIQHLHSEHVRIPNNFFQLFKILELILEDVY